MFQRFLVKSFTFTIAVLVSTLILTGCNATEGNPNSVVSVDSATGPSGTPNPNPTATPTPTPTPTPGAYKADVLVFAGTGVDTSGLNSIISILSSHGLTYAKLTSSQLNSMTPDDVAQYRLLIWPGGSNSEMDSALTAAGRRSAHLAVTDKGMNYLGICAGAFIAVGPTVAPDGTPDYGLAVVDDNYLQNYTPSNGEISMQMVSFPDGSQRDLILWYGPYFNWSQGVIAKYSNGTGAIVQAAAGKGFAVLSGVHPEAPASWATSEGLTDTDGVDTALAWKLIQAAYSGTRLTTF